MGTFYLDNVELEKLTNGTISFIAMELGCPIRQKEIEMNKYLKLALSNKSIKINDLINTKEYIEEQARVDKINDANFNWYMEESINWLAEHGYVIER